MPYPYAQEDDEWSRLISDLAGESPRASDPSDADIEAAIRSELGLSEEPSAIITDDPYTGSATAPSAPMEASAPTAQPDPYASARAKGLGPETAAQMAASDAPVYVPTAPPPERDAMATWSDEKGNLAGVDPRLRDTDSQIARLTSLRSARRGDSAPAHEYEDRYKRDLAEQDSRAQDAFAWTWISHGPEAASQFRQSYENKRNAWLQGLNQARDRDLQQNQQKAPITDAQAEELVRVYGITPEAASRMTGQDWNQMLPVIKGAPYVLNQQDKTRNNQSQAELDFIKDRLAGLTKALTGLTGTQIGGENAAETVKANWARSGGGAGGGEPADLVAIVAGRLNLGTAEVQAVADMLAAGKRPESGTKEDKVAQALTILRKMPAKKLREAGMSAFNRGGLGGAADKSVGVNALIEARIKNPHERLKLRNGWEQSWRHLKAAKAGFDLLKKAGKLDAFVKLPFSGWNSVIQAMFTGPEQKAARDISALVNPEMRKQAGAALSGFERDMTFTQYGLSSDIQLFADPAALEGFLTQTRDDLLGVHKAINDNYRDVLPPLGVR